MGERDHYTLEDLARSAGMTARNVRAYQTRGLLPPPVRDGRAALYAEAHLVRLLEIRRLREADVPLRMILRAVAQGESLDEHSPLHRWATGPDRAAERADEQADEQGGAATDEPDDVAVRTVDAEVLERAEEAVPGIGGCLTRLRLLWADGPERLTFAPLADLLDRLPVGAASHVQVLGVITGAAALADSLGDSLAGTLDGARHMVPWPVARWTAAGTLAHLASAVVHACLLRPDQPGATGPDPG